MKPEPRTAAPDLQADESRAWLSALVDGQADAAEQACGLWREDAAARREWHAYHLIGDVMRSEELARPATRDAAFLACLRERLATEPVVLAPVPSPVAAPARRQAWLVPVAAAAGFVVVAGVLVVTRVSQTGVQPVVPAGTELAQQVPSDPAGVPRSTKQVLLRDPLLDEYMRAHRSVGNNLSVSAPGGTLRRVELSVPASPER
jgi:sigma-E factor negative regulatory protein RseA